MDVKNFRRNFFVGIFLSEFFRRNFFVRSFFVRRRSVVRSSVVRPSRYTFLGILLQRSEEARHSSRRMSESSCQKYWFYHLVGGTPNTAASDRSDRSRDRSIESIDSIDSIIFRSFEIFSNFRWRRRGSNGPKIIKIRAILAKKFGRTNSDEKNGGQGTGARHGRCGGKARVINGDSWGAKPPRPPPGGKARVTEFPEGGKPPQTPPRHHFKKFALQGQIF